MAHTPGPWLRDGHFVYALHHYGWKAGQPRMVNRFSASVQISNGVPEDEAIANAHLIAAAPELLEALKLFTTCFPAAIAALNDEQRQLIHGAIAKAGGRS